MFLGKHKGVKQLSLTEMVHKHRECLVRSNKWLAQTFLPSLAFLLESVVKLLPRVQQTWMWFPGNPQTVSCVYDSGSQGCPAERPDQSPMQF